MLLSQIKEGTMEVDSTANNAVVAPQPQSMSRDEDYARQLAEFEASPLRQAAADIGACIVCAGGVGFCVAATLGCVLNGKAGCISASVALGLCCLGFTSMAHANIPSNPNDEFQNRDG